MSVRRLAISYLQHYEIVLESGSIHGKVSCKVAVEEKEEQEEK